jgi:hypothetical protein
MEISNIKGQRMKESRTNAMKKIRFELIRLEKSK